MAIEPKFRLRKTGAETPCREPVAGFRQEYAVTGDPEIARIIAQTKSVVFVRPADPADFSWWMFEFPDGTVKHWCVAKHGPEQQDADMRETLKHYLGFAIAENRYAKLGKHAASMPRQLKYDPRKGNLVRAFEKTTRFGKVERLFIDDWMVGKLETGNGVCIFMGLQDVDDDHHILMPALVRFMEADFDKEFTGLLFTPSDITTGYVVHRDDDLADQIGDTDDIEIETVYKGRDHQYVKGDKRELLERDWPAETEEGS